MVGKLPGTNETSVDPTRVAVVECTGGTSLVAWLDRTKHGVYACPSTDCESSPRELARPPQLDTESALALTDTHAYFCAGTSLVRVALP